MKILVIDDDEDIREIIIIYLQSAGHEVHEAENAEVALGMIDSSYSLQLVDYKMPGMSGEDYYHEVIKRNIDVPFVLVTGMLRDSDFCTVIKKPFSKSDLVWAAKHYGRE